MNVTDDEQNVILIDLINILSFVIGVKNLDSNDKQVRELEEHLSKQDTQYDKIIELLNELKGETHE